MKKQVVVTGIGIVSPIGIGKDKFKDALSRGRCGIGEITRFKSNGFPVQKAAEVKNFPHRPEWEGLDRFIRFALLAAEEAIEDAGLTPEDLARPATGMTVSSSKGGFETLEKLHGKFLNNGCEPDIIFQGMWENFMPDACSLQIRRRYKISGPVSNVVTACATGTHSIISGYHLIKSGDADLILAGASESALTPLLLAGYYKMGALARECMRPFDKERDGFIPGEGAAVLILEEKERAERRQAHCYGEITGTFMGEEPGHITDLSAGGDTLCTGLRELSNGSGIDYINTHGTATKSGDLYEAVNIKKAFGKEAYNIPLSSTKSMTGHLLGAAGAVEAAVCLLAMEDSFIPPTINYERPDPECDLDWTPNSARKKELNTTISVSIGFGGHIGIIMFKRNHRMGTVPDLRSVSS